ncbi:MAG: sugar phosphorylase, partial [Desulfobulbaceae bacterium]|nr:sugar phosphorylase [Desulfobulbaceae bacterium]
EPYELNITWFSALNREGEEDVAFHVKRFVASRIISFVLQGVPGIYLHSLIGTPNDIAAVYLNASKRDINRSVINGKAFAEALEDPLSKISRISRELGRLTAIRIRKRAFHPHGPQKILTISKLIFAVYRTSPEGDQHILALINVSNRVCRIEVPLSELNTEAIHWYDLVSEMEWMADDGKLYLSLQPYDVIWLAPLSETDINSGR